MTDAPPLCARCRTELADASPDPAIAALLTFTPVPVRRRVDGWSPDVQRAFIEALARTGSPHRAALLVGRKGVTGAERLRSHPGAASFAAAWDGALAHYRRGHLHALKTAVADAADPAMDLAALDPPAPDSDSPEAPADQRARLEAITLHRALHGDVVPVFHGGRVVGSRRVFNDQLALYHLRHAESGPGAPTDAAGDADRREAAIAAFLRDHPGTFRSQAERCLDDPQAWHEEEARHHRRQIAKGQALIARIYDKWRTALADNAAKAEAFALLFGADVAATRGHVLTDFFELCLLICPEVIEDFTDGMAAPLLPSRLGDA